MITIVNIGLLITSMIESIPLPELDYKSLLNFVGSLLIGYIGYRQHLDGKKTENNSRLIESALTTIKQFQDTLNSTLTKLEQADDKIQSMRNEFIAKEQEMNLQIFNLMKEKVDLEIQLKKYNG